MTVWHTVITGKKKNRILKEELPRSVGAQYATGDQWRNNSRKNEGKEPEPKQYPVVDVTGDRSKVRCCKEQHMYVHIYNYDSFSLCMAETSILWQNPAHCKGIILQLKIKKKNKILKNLTKEWFQIGRVSPTIFQLLKPWTINLRSMFYKKRSQESQKVTFSADSRKIKATLYPSPHSILFLLSDVS